MNLGQRHIIESIQIDSLCTVDETNGVIRNVRVLGPKSPNCHDIPGVTKGTQYLRSAMESGLPMYNGAPVYIDHPDRRNPGMDRPAEQAFGKLENARINVGKDGDETRADLPYYKSHPMTARVVEDVQRKIGNYALSHNAVTGKAKVLEGIYVVETLEEVRSVDMVTRGATNKNLWESREPKMQKYTLRAILEARAKKNMLGARGKHLLEDSAMADMMDKTTDVDAETPDHEAALDSGIAGALKALVDDYISGDMDEAAVGKKFCQIVKAHGKIKAGGKDTEEEYEEDEKNQGMDKGAGKSGDKDKEEMESLRLQVKVMGQVIESKKFPNKVQVKALCSKDLTEAERKQLLESFGKHTDPLLLDTGAKSGNKNDGGKTTPKTKVYESKSPEDLAKLCND